MKSSVRPLFSVLLLLLLVATLSCRFSFYYGSVGFGFVPSSFDYYSVVAPSNTTFDFPILNSTLLKLSEIDPGEAQMKMDSDRLLRATFDSLSSYRPLVPWKRFFFSAVDLRSWPPTSRRAASGNFRSPEFNRIWLEFRRLLIDWSRKRRYSTDIMSELVDLVRVPIDGTRKKYSSCSVVGNSGVLLNAKHGAAIDAHEAVIRLNNARIEGFAADVGTKTTISFVNSNILHLCSRRRRRLNDYCRCHPYGPSVPIVLYICQPVHFLDYASCKASKTAPMVITDPRIDMFCARLVKYYSLRRFFFGPVSDSNRTLERWSAAHDGEFFHYSSGMQAVAMAVGVCERVSLYGFGKTENAKHHYYTNQKGELSLHDYEAEYEFYKDLVERPQLIPFVSKGFKFPPVEIHR